MSGKGNEACEKLSRETFAKYGHLVQRTTQTAGTKEFRMAALCGGQVGPVPKLDGEMFYCELEPDHAMPHIASDGTWFDVGGSAHQMTAAEKAMQDIGAALESYFNGAQSEPNALNSIARIVGRYDIERIGEGEG